MNKHTAGREGDIEDIAEVDGYSLPQSCCFCRSSAQVQHLGFLCVEKDDFSVPGFHTVQGVL